ncbi:MAG TPA: hypothetical protein VEM15_11060 [Thermodesulfobacteriota bacterium]|nr:hypothetical protein [Thermodesulfobacteriota bacterium]
MGKEKKSILWRLIILTCSIVVWGCTSTPNTLDPSVSGPQAIVNPETIRLSVSKLKDTNIVFEGSGFKSGDSVLVTLLGPKETKVFVAEAPVKPDGTFKALVSPLTRFMEILRADITFDEKFQNVVIISQPPIPEGVYTARVGTMISKQTAETKLTVKGPSMIDRLKDWIGGLMGKVKYKKGK